MKKLIAVILSSLMYIPAVQCTSLEFAEECGPPHVSLAFVGDILLHRALQVKGLKDGFETLWHQAIPFFKGADFVYGNLEGPIGGPLYPNGQVNPQPSPKGVYTGYPLFNYPDEVAPALKKSGFDIVSIANNHIMDRGQAGLSHTLDLLAQNDLVTLGAQSHGSQDDWVKITKIKGLDIAWIACTEHTNGMPDPDHQILSCTRDKIWILETIKTLKPKTAAIILTPHWGIQYQFYPTKDQQSLAKQWLEAGAMAVIGSHPHVLQPFTRYITQDNRNTLIAYSLGNFVSNQGRLQNRSSLILFLNLSQSGDKTTIHSIQYVPVFMQNRSGLAQMHLKILNEPNEIILRMIGRRYAFSSPERIGSCPPAP